MKLLRYVPVILAFLLLGAINLSAAEILTNDTVLTMVKAGLGDDLIISKLKTSQNQFDLSTDSILKLKKAGVSEKVIGAMLETSAKTGAAGQASPPAGPGAATATPPGMIPGATGDSSSLFVKVREKVVEMPPVVAEAQHSVAKHFIPFYFGPGDTWHYIRGNKSIVRIAERKPVFLTKVNPSAFLLLKLAYQAERDIRYAVSTGSAYKNSLPIKVTKQPGDVFELTPGSELEPGEYAFVTSTTFYDFGIE